MYIIVPVCNLLLKGNPTLRTSTKLTQQTWTNTISPLKEEEAEVPTMCLYQNSIAQPMHSMHVYVIMSHTLAELIVMGMVNMGLTL